jgi:hypothetical protein
VYDRYVSSCFQTVDALPAELHNLANPIIIIYPEILAKKNSANTVHGEGQTDLAGYNTYN